MATDQGSGNMMQSFIDYQILKSQEQRQEYMVNGVKEANEAWQYLSPEEKICYQEQAAKEPVALQVFTAQGAHCVTCTELRQRV